MGPTARREMRTRAEAVFDAADVGDNTFVDGLIHYSVVVAGWVQDPIRTLACSAPISHVSLRRTVLENRLARMTMKITGYSGIYRDIPGFRGMDGTMTIYPHGRDAVGSSPGGVRRRQPRLPSPSQPPSWRHEIPRDPIILPSHPAISRYIPVYPTISRYSSVQSHRPPVCADDGHPRRKAVSQEEIARNPIRAELQYASRSRPTPHVRPCCPRRCRRRSIDRACCR